MTPDHPNSRNAPDDAHDDAHDDARTAVGNSAALPPAKPGWALFLDVDGTLVEIAAEPDSVHVDDTLVSLLADLQNSLDGAVALVSGRSVKTLDRLFAPLRLPAAGNHGLERRGRSGALRRPEPSIHMPVILRKMEAFAAQHPGVVVEDKTLSMGLHFRNCPEVEGAATALAQDLIGELGDGLYLQKGKMMVEIRPGQGDKGTAITDFMMEAPFRGRLPVFIGDDVTDESGFEQVNAQGGHSIRVGNGNKTAARYRVADVMGVVGWLAEIVKVER